MSHLPQTKWRFLISSALATWLEYLDFALYAHTSTIFAYCFFPQNSKITAVFMVWLPFLLGFLARPIGAIGFGYLGDKQGCRFALSLSMAMMAFATIGIGLIPTYSQIGWGAPIILVGLRLLQGIAVSPEYNGAGIYLSQYGERSLYNLKCSLTCVMTGLGMMSGSLIIGIMTSGYQIIELPSWRWRLPYITSGLLLGTVGLLLRLNMDSSRPAQIARNPLKNLIQQQPWQSVEAFLVSGYVGMISYALFGFFGFFLQIIHNYSISLALGKLTNTTLLIICSNLLAALSADFFSRRHVMAGAAFSIALTSPICYMWLDSGSDNLVTLSFLLYGATTGLFTGVLPGYLATLFASSHRYTGACVMYNLGIAIVGGSTPMLFMYLAKQSIFYPAIITVGYSLLIYVLLKRDSSVKINSFQYAHAS